MPPWRDEVPLFRNFFLDWLIYKIKVIIRRPSQNTVVGPLRGVADKKERKK